MYEAAFKRIDNILREDAGCSSELEYVQQTSWILFLKYLDDFEAEKEKGAEMDGKSYKRIINGDFRWGSWAAPKNDDGKIDYKTAMTGADLLDFVNDRLFPHLANFKQMADNPSSITYKIGEIFGEVGNKVQSGYALRDVIDKVDDLSFLSNEDMHELSSLYEDKIKNMGNAGRNGGEYYTPRPLIKSIVKIINPRIGEKVYDGAVGSAGFLCEAYTWMTKQQSPLSRTDYERLQKRTFIGKEKKPLPYVIGVMNMILHGIEAPNIIHTNTLTEKIADIQQKNRVDVVLANPPFGGEERAEVKENFPIKSDETAYLFLQHYIKILKAGGRAGVVIKNTFLSNGDATLLRKQLLEECNLYAVLDLPKKTFNGTGVGTIVLFFNKGKPTDKIWYYQLNVGRSLGKTSPLNEEDLAEFVKMSKSRKKSANSWLVNVADLNQDTWDLTAKNPNRVEEVDNRTPKEIITEIEGLDVQGTKALRKIRKLL